MLSKNRNIGLSVKEIHHLTGINRRTLYRDLFVLSEVGVQMDHVRDYREVKVFIKRVPGLVFVRFYFNYLGELMKKSGVTDGPRTRDL